MKRPLAFFGIVYLLAMLAAVQLPVGALAPAAVVCLAAFFAVAAMWRRWPRAKKAMRSILALGTAAAGLAATVFLLHHVLFVQPVQNLAGGAHVATARVMNTQASYGGETMQVTLRVLRLDGEEAPPGLSVVVSGFAEVQVGDVVRTELSFYELGGRSTSYSYAKGQYVGARAGETQVIGQDLTFLCRMRLLQYAASENIRMRLPQRLSGVAAAMAVGDNRFLPGDAKAAYRAAGLSHILVVSGMHLSVLCSAVYALARRVVHRKRLAAALCLVFVALFMAFTGFSPSVVRSGVAFLLVYAATLFYRKADIYTSLGVAALLLCTQNPYAAADVGLLLSFSATLGALAGGWAAGKMKRPDEKQLSFAKRAGRAVARAAAVPVCVTLATLPVLLMFGMQLSLLGIPANILVVPLTTPVLLAGILMALPALPVLNTIAQLAAIVAGALLVVFEKITEACAAVPNGLVYVGGTFAVAILLLYPLGLLAFKSRRFKAYLLAALVVVGLGAGLQVALGRGVVRVTVVGSGAAASVVVTQDGSAAVVYRNRQSLAGIQEVLAREGARDCALVVDMRQSSQGTETVRLNPEQTVIVAEDIVSRAVYEPFGDVKIYVARQSGGMAVCVDVAGYKVGIVNGAFNLASFAPLDVLVPGRSRPEGKWGTTLVAGAPPEWLTEEDNEVLASNGRPYILVRPGKSAVFKEVYDGDVG